MASLLAPPAAAQDAGGRISQLLPTVKCSSCNNPVPIHELGDHTCTKAAAAPAAQTPPPPSPSFSSFLSRGLQNFVSTDSTKPQSPATPPPQIPPAKATPTTSKERKSRGISFGFKKSSASPSQTPSSRPPIPTSPLASQYAVKAPPRQDSRISTFSTSSSLRSRSPAPSLHVPPVPFPADQHTSTLSVESPTRTRAVSTASSTLSGGSRPSTDMSRARSPSSASSQQHRPSFDSSRSRNLSSTASSSSGRLTQDMPIRARTPSDNSQFRPSLQSSPSNQSTHSTHSPELMNRIPNANIINSFPPVPEIENLVQGSSPRPASIRSRISRASMNPPESQPQTQTGGEAGMAGVGRRGFHAAARAAMFMAPFVNPHPMQPPHPAQPGYLDIGKATNNVTTPPLSPSYSSNSPMSPISSAERADAFGRIAANPAIAPRTPSPSDILRNPYTDEPMEPQNNTTYTDKDFQNNRPMTIMSDSEFGGLAYADSNEDEDEERSDEDQYEFPSYSPRTKTFSAASSASNYTSLDTSKQNGNKEPQTMDTLFEDDPEPNDSARKVPTRALTSPADSTFGHEDAKKPSRSPTIDTKTRHCTSCDDSIDDGKWIPMDGGGVLCDKCWKNMYLPKCRRCNLPIEKQAVSSSDGQLKGKYHRDCFNCHECHKPFPDKSFYVFEGKPFCAYHYHEANGSLCAAPSCGQPIEGPCAVSHAGEKYHPQHFVCEYPRCTERLDEYWEVDGKMLCEHHYLEEEEAMRESSDLMDDLMNDLGVENYRHTIALKRQTRFIDLGGFGGR